MNGRRDHEKLMEEACENFQLDINQIEKLYELILKESAGRATKKAYKEMYNSNYLNKIEEKERNFEEEITSLRLNMGSFINSNYWRVEGIRNIYKVFQDLVTEEFGKDLSEYNVKPKIEEAPIISNYVQDEKDTINEKSEENNMEYNKEENYYEDDQEGYEEDEEYEDYEDYEEDENEEEVEKENSNDDIDILLQGLSEKEDEEENLDEIIQKSRRKTTKKKSNNQENKGLFNKFFKNKNTSK